MTEKTAPWRPGGISRSFGRVLPILSVLLAIIVLVVLVLVFGLVGRMFCLG